MAAKNPYSRVWIPAPKISMQNGPGQVFTYQTLLASMPATNGLRRRMYGRKRVDDFFQEHEAEFVSILTDDSPHQTVRCRAGWIPSLDTFKIAVICSGCERVMSVETSGPALDGDDWERVLVKKMAQLVDTACHTECFGIRERAMLAEWATNRLHRAGERGIPYVQMVHEAVEARMVTPAEVDGVLRDMKFVSEWVTLANSGLILPGGWNGEWALPVLHLPAGHPLRTW